MLYACLLLYVTLIYVRPAEIVSDWATIPFVDILTVIAAIVGVFSLAMKPRRFLNLPQDKLVIAFWAIIAISSFKIWLTGVWLAWLAFMPVVFCYFLIRAAITTRGQLLGFIYLLIGLNIFLAINGIVQYHTGVGLGNIEMRFDRIYGTGIFNDPNDLGMTFVMSVPLLVLVMLRPGTGIIMRILSFVALITVCVAIYYTNSRGALVGLTVAVISMSLLRFKTVAGTFVGALLLCVIVVAAPSRGSEITAGESSAQSRIHSWAEGWNMLKWFPITGVGYGQFTEWNPRVAHNSFVETFAELGLIGAFIFVGMFYWYFKGLRLIPETDKELAARRRALIASAAGVLTCGWFLSRQYVPIFYVLLAMGACSVNMHVPEEAQSKVHVSNRDVVMIGGLTFAGIIIVYVSIRTLAIWG